VAIGVCGTFGGDGIALDELVDRVTALTDREPLVLPEGPERIRRIGIVSGAGADYLADAAAAGMDAFLTGEPAERIAAVAREERISVVAAGHHATETFGVRRLGDLLAREHQIVHRFIDIPNPI
jgi:putative NIF3 family GTP cyclohydrolase 1 type 2